ncbi:MAG: ribonucleotide-diphosphate reductase subunit alpha, partial [Rhodospirillales bacterium]
IDQRWLIEHAADRAPFICQAQSLNIFLPADVHKRDLHQIHMMAWKRGVKSLYYLRSKSLQRAEVASGDTAAMPMGDGQGAELPLAAIGLAGHGLAGMKALNADKENTNDYEECLSCQ